MTAPFAPVRHWSLWPHRESLRQAARCSIQSDAHHSSLKNLSPPQQTIEEFATRVGQQAVVLVATPGKPNTSYRVFGAKPLEDVVRNLRCMIMEELENALAQQVTALRRVDLFTDTPTDLNTDYFLLFILQDLLSTRKLFNLTLELFMESLKQLLLRL